MQALARRIIAEVAVWEAPGESHRRPGSSALQRSAAGRAPGFGVGEALAIAVQPDDLAPEGYGIGEQVGAGCQRDAQSGLDQLGLEPAV